MSTELDPAVFAQIASELHEAPDHEHTLERVVTYACQALACDQAGLLLARGHGRPESAAATTATASRVDELQAEYGEGPALWAMQQRATVLVHDIGNDPRWPQWAPAAEELGVRCVVSVRLFNSSRTLGALNLYTSEPEGFDEDDTAVAEIFALHASVAVATAGQAAGLRTAIDARHLVGQAQGILMERYGLDADRAFAVLRRLSRDSNTKLRDVAARLITTRQLPREP